jgi:hypothetical protein
MPDYTLQLNEIVKALNRPSQPQWVVVVLSTLCGMVGSLLLQVAFRSFTEWLEREKLRRLIYQDLIELFYCVHRTLTAPDESIIQTDKASRRYDELRRGISFRVEKKCADQADRFMSLDEHFAYEQLYMQAHRLIDDLGQGVPAMYANGDRLKTLFGFYINDGPLKRDLFKKYKPKLAKKFLLEVDLHESERQGRLNRKDSDSPQT